MEERKHKDNLSHDDSLKIVVSKVSYKKGKPRFDNVTFTTNNSTNQKEIVTNNDNQIEKSNHRDKISNNDPSAIAVSKDSIENDENTFDNESYATTNSTNVTDATKITGDRAEKMENNG